MMCPGSYLTGPQARVRPHDIDVKQLQEILLKEAAVFE